MKENAGGRTRPREAVGEKRKGIEKGMGGLGVGVTIGLRIGG